MGSMPKVSEVIDSLVKHYSEPSPGDRLLVVFHRGQIGVARVTEGEEGAEFSPPGEEEDVPIFGFDVIGPVPSEVQVKDVINLAEGLGLVVVVREVLDRKTAYLKVNPSVDNWFEDLKTRIV